MLSNKASPKAASPSTAPAIPAICSKARFLRQIHTIFEADQDTKEAEQSTSFALSIPQSGGGLISPCHLLMQTSFQNLNPVRNIVDFLRAVFSFRIKNSSSSCAGKEPIPVPPLIPSFRAKTPAFSIISAIILCLFSYKLHYDHVWTVPVGQ
ncbi:MAG: hypothetical protein DU429_00800 [Candidatus Tokpelaia sp.]|nr:MAG: hypothetical protein DU430_06590 [Candidatus Tokpelaia sp.]KAA6207629.1 MAG: hypothetical protein DU429_00800 [Candidatus Tokpelaia sp.]